MEKDEKLLFVGADLSGIQRFLYNITSYKAAVSLKGRSHYISEFTNRLCDSLLGLHDVEPYDMDGVPGGVVYCSGGKLYLIIKDSPAARSSIDILLRETELELWNKHHGTLGICITYVPFTFAASCQVILDDGTCGNIGLLWSKASELFTRGKAQKFHSIISKQYNSVFVPQPISDKMHVCALTGIEAEDCVPFGDKEQYILPSVMEQIELGKRLQSEQGFRSFEDYAKDSWLGVLRMDVDGLGARFIKGFTTFAQYHTFSQRLQDFFSTRISELSRSYKSELMVLYAGGDDLFAVGRWNSIAAFANDVHSSFMNDFASDSISISGGMVVVNAKFPIAKAAELAGDAEEAAKRFRAEKNAFCILGQPLSWDKEYDYVSGWRTRIVELCTTSQMPRSILHKIITFDSMRQQGKPDYLWNAAYYLARFSKDKKSPAVSDFCNDVKQEYFSTAGSSRNVELLALAARWAELEMRNNNEQ